MSPRRYPSAVERVAARTAVGGPDDCWPVSGYKQRSGHVNIWRDGGSVGVHRVVWESIHGPIPVGMCVCHSCDNPPCVNPAHLWLGTVADNNADRDRKGRGVTPPWQTVVRQKPGPIKHGTIYAYSKRKCRCDECREANRLYRNQGRSAA